MLSSRRTYCSLVTLSLLLGHGLPQPAEARSDSAALKVVDLKCEHLSEPLGIDAAQPQLSWRLQSGRRNVTQAAYQVIVADSREKLSQDHGNIWDSGKVDSRENMRSFTGEKPLNSDERYFWKVRVWDDRGEASPWSGASHWSMGLLGPEDWRAEWIGDDRARESVSPQTDLFSGAKWISFSRDKLATAPAGKRLFVFSFDLPAEAEFTDAKLLAVAYNRLEVTLNGDLVVPNQSSWRNVEPREVSANLKPGENEVRAVVTNDSVGPTALLFKLAVTTVDGKTSSFVSDGSWRAAPKPGNSWQTRPLEQQELTPCRVMGAYGMEPWGEIALKRLILPRPPYLRREFQLKRPVRRATLYASALGLADMYLNGLRVSDEYFTPGWTDYARRVYYRAYDVTDRVVEGANAVGAVLADGWYTGHVGWGQKRDHYGTKPRLKAQLNIVYEDGSQEVIGTNDSWRAGAGPTLEADFLMGETYDARAAIDGWSKPGFAASDWAPVSMGAEVDPVVQAHPGPPVVAIEEFEPVSVAEPEPGTYIFDLGRNFAGIARLRVQEKAGQVIQLRFAERLNPDGSLYLTNLRGARATDRYTCRGDGVETWSPRFTFHGFQYVEVTGLSAPPTKDTVTGVALSSDTPRAGSFECSDPMLNQLVSNIYWTQRANFIDIPTDCPQRDERLGWTGDAQVYIATACLNADVQAFFHKWLVDLTDAQRGDGQFPTVAPLKVAGDDGGPAWAEAGVIVPWTLYQTYGDEQLLRRQYPSMKKFVDFCRQRSTDKLLPPEKFHCYGDWLAIDAPTPKEVIYMAYYACSTQLLAESASVLGYQSDAEEYTRLLADIKRAFNETYVKADGRIEGDTQCAYVLALAYDLVEGDRRKQAADHLVRCIADRDYHLSTGFVGTKDLMLVLAKIGRNDLAYRLLHNESFPSWGFSIKHGATSIWERWDGWTPSEGFQDPGMNSFAHYSFGAVYQWMVENIGGIRAAAPGYERVTIAPQPGGKLTWAKTVYDSPQGPIHSEWKLNEGALEMKVVIPAGATAKVVIPGATVTDVTEGGQPLVEASDLGEVRQQGTDVALDLGSGEYDFVAKRAE